MLDFESVCRCCLQINDLSDLFEFTSEIAVDEQNYEKIHEIYEKILFTKICLDDPSKVCAICLQELKNAFVFQQKSMESNKIYMQELEIFKEIQLTNDEDIVNEYIPNEYIIMENEDSVKEEELIKQENYLDYIEEEFLEYGSEHMEGVPELTTDEEEAELNEGGDEKSKIVHMISPKSRKKMMKEILSMEEIISFNCSHCSKTFDRKNYYRRHWRRVHNDEELEAATEELIKLKRPDEIKDLQMYQCEYCANIEVIKSKHLDHLISHEGQDLFKCRHCELKFSTKNILKDHMMEHGDQKRFICDICGSTTKNKYALTLHYRRHTGEKPFVCPIEGCKKGFSMQSNMLKHVETHSSNRSFECEVCGQFCKTQRSLNFHIICFHKTESKIKCPDCDKAFVNKSYLKMHRQYHTGDKKFTCSICESKYYKSSHLKRHIQNVHFKLRLLKCDYCSSDFVRKETYRTHILNQHKSLSQEEINAVLEKIKNFRPPQLDVEQFTLEKQKYTTLHLQSDEPEQIFGDID